MGHMKKIDYSSYIPTKQVKYTCYLVGAAVGFGSIYLFYSSTIVGAVAAVIFMLFANPLYKRRYIKRRQTKLLMEFRDLLESLSSSLGAGENVRRAFKSAEEDMSLRHGKDSIIWMEVKLINSGIESGRNIEDMLADFGERSRIGDIVSFACVFETCFRRGGNIREVVNNSSKILCDKIDIQMEIRVLISGKKSEQNVMLVMPLVFTFILRWSGTGIADMGSASGVISTTVALVFFVIAYFIGRRILNINI